MIIILDYYNDEFRMKNADLSKVKPFSHANVVVNCDQPLSSTNGPLEREVEKFLSNALVQARIKARWDRSSEWTQSQRVDKFEFPRINKLIMGVDFFL